MRLWPFFRRRERPKPQALVIGLGNPGAEYAATRHNVGFRAVEQLALVHDIHLGHTRHQSIYGEGHVGDAWTLLALPQTFMNRCGAAVASLADRYGAGPSDIVVACDDLNLPLGKLRIRRHGSAGGHRGLQSVIDALGTSDFPRLRIGIGPRPRHTDAVDFVLSPFRPREAKVMDEHVIDAGKALRTLIVDGVEEAMNAHN
ncbi:MAG: aminoacyl-tRNA hydrolase [Armatimonadota bacterium]|jgi:PTH1 family peptidyl-tRNA hydrolase